MAHTATLVDSAVPFELARLQTGPGSLRATNRFRVRLATLARHDDRLRTRRTRSRMAQQDTVVTAVRHEPLPASLATRVRYQPEVICRVQLLGAKALVVARNVHRFVLLAALGTVPVHRQGRLRDVLAPTVVVTFLLFVGDSLLRNAIVRPPLNAQQMKERVATLAGPDRVRPLHRANADQTNRRTGLQQVLQVLLGLANIPTTASVVLQHGSQNVLRRAITSTPLILILAGLVRLLGGVLFGRFQVLLVGLSELFLGLFQRTRWATAVSRCFDVFHLWLLLLLLAIRRPRVVSPIPRVGRLRVAFVVVTVSGGHFRWLFG